MTVVLGQNWEVSPILSAPGDWMPVAIATDSLCQPRVAFGVSGSGVIGYASRDGDTWNFNYPDSGGAISSIELCQDSCDLPHMGYVVSRYPEPSELRYAFRDGDSWRIDTVAGGASPGWLELGALALARDGTPHIVFVDSVTLEYARVVGDTWSVLTVPAYQADSLRRLGGASLALDTNDQPGVAVTWTKPGAPRDSLWLSFFEYDGQDWHRFDIDSTEGWAPWDFWPVRVRYDPASDLFHVVYRAYRCATGKGENWQVEAANVTAGNVLCDFVLYQGRAHIVCASPRDPLTYQWQWAGGWGTEMIVNRSTLHNPSIAVDRTGRPHIAFQDDDTVFYARRLFVGAEEPPTIAQPDTRLLVYPNPVPRTFTVEFTVPRRTSTAITLIDASGRTVWSQKENLGPGCYRRSISLLASVRPGVYFCTLDNGARRISQKVVATR